MNVEDLNPIAALAKVAERGALTAEAMVMHGRHEEAAQSASAAARAAAEARLALEALGAAPPANLPDASVPFHLLDVPEARELLDALERIAPLAERLDARRGRVLDTKIGPMGYDVAQSFRRLTSRLALEVRGPSSAVTGGRE